MLFRSDAWRAALVAHFRAHEGDLSDDSKARLEKNPLRILDSKDPRDRPAADSAPKMVLSGDAEDFFGKVREGLDAAGVAYEIAPHLVRGLDYYRHTAFEFVTDRLGAQGTVLGGGRYDGLIETLGGPHTPAVGWAAGIERLGMLLTINRELPPSVVIAFADEEGRKEVSKIARILRSEGISCQFRFKGSLSTQIAKGYSDAENHPGQTMFAIIVGAQEVASKRYNLRGLSLNRNQVEGSIEELVAILRDQVTLMPLTALYR